MTDLLGGSRQAAVTSLAASAQRQAAHPPPEAHRSPVTPDLPRLPRKACAIDVDIWYALFAPAGLPREMVSLLNVEMAAILAQSEVRDNLQKQGLNPVTGTPEELARLVEADLERWTRVVRAARISAD